MIPMKHIFLIFIILLLKLSVFAEDFYIENFYVNIEVMPDGSLEITEKISVNFTTAKRGIIRTIPIQYHISYLPDSLKSLRAEPTSSCFIKIYDLSVENFTFETTENYGNLEIKIGSSNKLVEGKQHYILHYKVSGVVNPFEMYDEINWNIIGNEWNVPINKVNFEIKLNKSLNLKNTDIQLVTGLKGQQNHDANFELKPSKIIGESTKLLNPNEGISIALKFKKKYLEATYKIEKIKSSIFINNNGSCNYADSIEVNFNNYQNGFIYEIPRFVTDENGKKHEIFLKFNTQKSKYKVIVKEKGDFFQFHIGSPNKEPMLSGKQVFELKYQTWGNIFLQNKTPYFAWIFFTESAKYQIFNTQFVVASNIKLNFESLKNRNDFSTNFSFSKNKIEYNSFNTNKLEYFILKLTENTIGNLPDSEIIKSATNYYIGNINVNINIKNDRNVHLCKKIELNFFENYNVFEDFPFVYTLYKTIYKDDYHDFASKTFRTERFGFFNNVYKPYYSNVEFTPNTHVNNFTSEQQYTWYSELENQNNTNIQIEYDVFDITSDTDSGSIIHIPILTSSSEPVKEFLCTFELPQNIDYKSITCYITFNDSLSKTIPFIVEKNKVIIKQNLINAVQTPFAIAIRFPQSVFTNTSLSSEIKLFLLNNASFLIPFFVLILLLTIWFLIGKDLKNIIIVQYQAPENITPSEAGLLWDNKLHKRDLIALFYYWAAKNYISIIENESEEISFKLLQNLPSTAKSYEKTIFKSIFKTKKIGEIVTLKQFKGNFDKIMQKSFNQMINYAKVNNFYTPGTYGFGQILKIASIFIFASAVFAFLSEFRFNQLSVSLLITAGIVFIFGKIMPKRAHFGNKIFQHLIGFAEFIEKAEKERLQTLLAQNANYFYETIAYAVIMGKAETWSNKFSSLTIDKPDWYVSNIQKFNATVFTQNMLKTMQTIDKTLNFKPASSSNRSKWASSSKLSWSSGSSFRSSGSFRSGSGFGGGGGSSW